MWVLDMVFALYHHLRVADIALLLTMKCFVLILDIPMNLVQCGMTRISDGRDAKIWKIIIQGDDLWPNQ